MMTEALQARIDELLETSPQQWAVRLVIVLAPLGVLGAVTAEIGTWWPFGLVVVFALSAATAFRPDNDLALGVIALLGVHWAVTVEPIDTPWLPVAAICLLVYHSTCALSATFPTGGIVPVGTLLRWAQRIAVVSTATIAMWVLVVVLDRREAPGNGALTALALGILAVGALAIRWRSVDAPRR